MFRFWQMQTQSYPRLRHEQAGIGVMYNFCIYILNMNYNETHLNRTLSIPDSPFIPILACGPNSTGFFIYFFLLLKYTFNPEYHLNPNYCLVLSGSGLERFHCVYEYVTCLQRSRTLYC